MTKGVAIDLAQLLAGGGNNDERFSGKRFNGDLDIEIEVLRGVFAGFVAQEFQPGDIVRLRREWRNGSSIADFPCVVLEMVDPPIHARDRADAKMLHSISAAETLDMAVCHRTPEAGGGAIAYLVDSRRFELIARAEGQPA